MMSRVKVGVGGSYIFEQVDTAGFVSKYYALGLARDTKFYHSGTDRKGRMINYIDTGCRETA